MGNPAIPDHECPNFPLWILSLKATTNSDTCFIPGRAHPTKEDKTRSLLCSRGNQKTVTPLFNLHILKSVPRHILTPTWVSFIMSNIITLHFDTVSSVASVIAVGVTLDSPKIASIGMRSDFAQYKFKNVPYHHKWLKTLGTILF